MDKYCGDCMFLCLKRNKGIVTGEHICIEWDTLHSEFQSVGNCSLFLDRADYRKPLGKPTLNLPEMEDERILKLAGEINPETGELVKDYLDAAKELLQAYKELIRRNKK